MWELRGTPKTLKVTKKMATEWSEMETAKTDRPLSERRLQVYRKIVNEGAFRPVSWARAFCKETGGVYRVNGKHTSTLFSTLDLSSVSDLYAVLEDYDCETLEDVAKLYSTFDSRTQSRTSSDVNRSFSAVIPELVNVPSRIINLCVAGLGWEANAVTPTEGTAPDKAERLFDNVDRCLWFDGIMHGGSRAEHIQRVAVAGAMFVTEARSHKDATEFWTTVRDETGAKPSLPDRKLARYLTMTVIDAGNGTNKSRRFRATQREFYVKCLHAWNAWRKGETTDLKYYPDADLPSVR